MFDGNMSMGVPVAGTGRWWVLTVVVAAQFMFVVDAFIVNVALPSITADLHAEAGAMEAVIAVYQAAYAALVITGGRLGDIYGRKPVFIVGVLAFTAASAWCGLSASATELVLARLAQGATAALMVPQVLATLHVLFPGEGRNRAFAVFGIALGTGGAVGFLLGGWLVTLDPVGLGWRSVFLVNLPIGGAVALAAVRLMPALPRQGGMRLDWVGTTLLLLAMVGLLGPLLAGARLGWPWWLWVVEAGAALVLGLSVRLARWVQRRGGQLLLEPALLQSRAFQRGLAAASSFQFGNIAFYLTVTLVMQGRLGLTPLQSGAVLVPLALAFTVASQLAGRWTQRYGMQVLSWGCAAQLLGITAFAAVLQVPAAVLLVSALAVFGFGQGLVMAPLAGLVLANVAPAQAGSASGMLNTVQQASGAIGVTTIGSVYAVDGAWAGLAVLGLSVVMTATLLRGFDQARS
jgi:EmrB/QacA subfamily drug resistance transporter